MRAMLHGRFSEQSARPVGENVVLRGPRVVRDVQSGDTITVVERRADGVAGARGPACLIFSTERGFIRLWHYPENWDALTDRELVWLSERPRRSQSA